MKKIGISHLQGLLIICEIREVISATSLKLNLVHIIPIKKGISTHVILHGDGVPFADVIFCGVFFHNRSLKKCVLFKTRLILNEKRLFSLVFEFVNLKSLSKEISLPPPPSPPPPPS